LGGEEHFSEYLSKNSFLGRYLWRFFLPDAHEPERSGNWTILARTRLAQRRAEKPVTKYTVS
jgi:hypothetical protein